MSLFLKVAGVLIGVAGCAITFRSPKASILWAALIGLLGWEVQEAMLIMGCHQLISTTCGALTIAICSELMARSLKMPATIFLVNGILPLVPGMRMYQSMMGYIKGLHASAEADSIQAMLAAGGIAIGMLMGNAIARAWIHPVLNRFGILTQHEPPKHTTVYDTGYINKKRPTRIREKKSASEASQEQSETLFVEKGQIHHSREQANNMMHGGWSRYTSKGPFKG